jgi:hypothetical protein
MGYFNSFKLVPAKTVELANLYKSTFEKRGDVIVETEYVLECDSFLFFKGDRLIGGCILNSGDKMPLRYLEVYKNKEDKILSLETEGIKESEILEMTCIFLNPESHFERIAFYTFIFYKTRSLARAWGKKVILGGSIHTKVQKIQMRLMRHVLLRSNVNETLAMDKHKNCVVMVYYCKSSEFLSGVIFVLIGLALESFTRKQKVLIPR